MLVRFTDPSVFVARDNRFYVESALDRFIESAGFSEAMLLRSPAGVGKTDAIEHYAFKNNHLLIRFSCTEQTDDRHLLGSMTMEDGATLFSAGALLTAVHLANENFKNGDPVGVILFLDEINTLTPEAQKYLNPLMDGTGSVVARTGVAERLLPGAKLWVVAAANPNYAGTYSLNPDLLSRFPIIQDVPYLDTATESDIVTRILRDAGRKEPVGLSNTQFANGLVMLAAETRSGVRPTGDARKFSWTLSTRDLVATAKLSARGDTFALQLLANKFSAADRQDVAARIKSALNIDIGKGAL
ncbi:AAA family ATPase [bacterium]|nr:AAA family ATPase [bacterium]